MRFQSAFWLLLTSLAAICQADLLQYADMIPQCGLNCILGELSASVCKTVGNTTCICTDTSFYDSVQTCVLSTCTVEQALQISRIQDEACDRPYRSRRNELWGFIGVEAFALICIALHIIARRFSLREYGIDDYIVFVVLALYLPFTLIGQYARLTGFGVDIWTESSATITMALKLFFIDESFYLALLALCKIVMLCFFLRIFPNKWFRTAVYAVIGFVASSAIVLIFLQIFQCWPIDYNWEGWKGTYGSHHCLNINTLTYTAGAISIFQDCLLLLLPLPLLLTLNTSWRKKANIIVMFSLGFFILLTSSIRLRYIVQFARTVNPTWDYVNVIIWTALEVNVSIIVISLPAIRAFLSQLVPKMFGTTLGSTSASQPISRTRGTKLTSSRHKGSKFSSVFSTTRRADDDADSQLELGDRKRGQTQTEIAVDYGQSDDRSNDSATSQPGIHVRKETFWREEDREKAFR